MTYDHEPAGTGPEAARVEARIEVAPGMPPVPDTGDGRVDAALERLEDLDRLPTDEHVGRYDTAHGELQQVLADLDTGDTGDTSDVGDTVGEAP